MFRLCSIYDLTGGGVDVLSSVDVSPSSHSWSRCCNTGVGLQLVLVAWQDLTTKTTES